MFCCPLRKIIYLLVCLGTSKNEQKDILKIALATTRLHNTSIIFGL